MKIVLVYCHIDEVFRVNKAGAFNLYESNPPLGVGSLAAVLKRDGHEVVFIDQLSEKHTRTSLAECIANLAPDVTGFSCTSLNIENSARIAEIVKRLYPQTHISVGGIHATLVPQQTSQISFFDSVIAGEGEYSFLAVVNEIGAYGKIVSDIPGCWIGGKKPLIDVAVLKNISVPYPDRHVLKIQNYKNLGALVDGAPCYSLFQSRGCPYTCTFCSKPSYHKDYRVKVIENTFEEIDVLFSEFGAESISFREDNFTANRAHLKNICKEFQKRYEGAVRWECESRADLTLDELKMMKDAGCDGIWCGIETVSEKWQRWINKKIPKKTVMKFYEDCSKVGISAGGLFMFGFLGQNRKEIEDDIAFSMQLPLEWRYFQSLAVFPGSHATKMYAAKPQLLHYLTEHVALSLIEGYSISDMIALENEINERVLVKPRTYY